MSKDPAFPFYASDWLGSTKRAVLTPAQRGAYIDLLCHQWGDKTCSLEDDDQLLAALSGLNEGWFNGGSAMLRKCFPPHPDLVGRIANPRLLELRAERDRWVEKSREGGRKSGLARKKRQRKGGSTTAPTNGQPKGNTPSPSPSPNKTPYSPPGDNGAFDRFWSVVHLKTGKEAARTAFAKAVVRVRKEGKRSDPVAYICDRMEAFAKTPKAHPTEHTPVHPSRWLNEGRYDDGDEAWEENHSVERHDRPWTEPKQKVFVCPPRR